MDAGTIVECDHPYHLLKNKNGFLNKMVEQTGQRNARFLNGLAYEVFAYISVISYHLNVYFIIFIFRITIKCKFQIRIWNDLTNINEDEN